jgi:O-antigen ligase
MREPFALIELTGMNKDAWDEQCSRGILGLVLALLVVTPVTYAVTGAWGYLVIQALTIGIMGLWALRLWVSPKPQFLWPPIVWPILAFALYAIGRYLTADIEYAARLEFIQVLVCTFLFLAILNNLYHQGMVKTLSYTLIFLAMAISSYAVAQHLTHSHHVWNLPVRDPSRASGTFMSPDSFCAFLEMILPLALSILLVGRIKPLMRVFLGYSCLVMLGGVVVTYSRAGWVATLAGLLVVLLILLGHCNHRKFAGIILLLLAGGGTWFITHILSRSTTFIQRIGTAQGGLNVDMFVRVKIWTAGLRMWLDHLWWGVGPGLFDWRFNEYRPQTVQTRPIWAHCDYLNLLTDWGLVGGLIVLAGIVLCLMGLVRAWPRVRRSESDFGSQLSNRFAFFLGVIGGLTALAVHCLVDFNLHVPADALLAVTLLALLSSNLRFATERYWHNLRLPLKSLATLVLAAGMTYLGWQEYRLAGQRLCLSRAARIPDYTLARAQTLQEAFACEPMNFENAYNIGECYRASGFNDPTNAAALLEQAMLWYQRSEKLNPHYSLNYLRQGNTLDFQERPGEAGPFYDHADALDPNGYYPAANLGWHYMQLRDYTAARIWLLRSLALQPNNNPIATNCLSVVEQELSVNAGALH